MRNRTTAASARRRTAHAAGRVGVGSAVIVAVLLAVGLMNPPALAASDPAPEAIINYQTLGLDAEFDAAGSFTGTYTWDYGDGSTGSGSSALHSFAAPGDYTVTLTVEDIGIATSSSRVVTVPSFRSGFEDTDLSSRCAGASAPSHRQPFFLPGSALERAGSETNRTAVEFEWFSNGSTDPSRLDKGADYCPDVWARGEMWAGFSFLLPSDGFPFDKEQGLFWTYNLPESGCFSWSSLMTVKDNSLSLSHRAGCGGGVSATLLDDIPRDTWIDVVVHAVPSRDRSGIYEVWIDAEDSAVEPVYRATGINWSWGNTWQDEHTIGAESRLSAAIGQYNYDVANWEPKGGARLSYIDNFSFLETSRSDAWHVVNPSGGGFARSVRAQWASSVTRTDGGADRLFDGLTQQPGRAWTSLADSATVTIKYPDGELVAVTTYELVASRGMGTDPAAWTLQGSNDATNWADLDRREGFRFVDENGAPARTQTFTVGNATPYLFYRLEIDSPVGSPDGDARLALWEWRLRNDG